MKRLLASILLFWSANAFGQEVYPQIYPDAEVFSGVMTSDLDLDGYDLWFDQDKDTGILNDRQGTVGDDEFHFQIGGAVDFKWTANYFTVVSGSHIDVEDDSSISWGDRDFWAEYDSSNTRFEMWTQDKDGSGTDGIIMRVADGTDDPVFEGAVDVVGNLTANQFTSDTSVFATNGMRVGAGQAFYWNGGTQIDDNSTDGVWRARNAGGTSGACWNYATDNTATFFARDCSSAGTFEMNSGNIQFGANTLEVRASSGVMIIEGQKGAAVYQMTADNSANGFLFAPISFPAVGSFTAASGEQYGMRISPVTLNQSGSAGFTAHHIDITDSGSGTDQDYLADWMWNSASEFQVEDDGDTIWSGGDLMAVAATTDAAATSIMLKGGDAYVEATGGNQVGGSLQLGGGIGTRQVTIDDYNNCGTDTVTVTIDGAASVLTEASEWTAATSDDATATSLASAVDALSGVSASATAAVVYITPDQNTHSVELAEGDATCTTLTQGANGQVLYAIGTEAAPTIAFEGYTDTGFGMTEVSPADRPAIFMDGAEVAHFHDDGSARTTVVFGRPLVTFATAKGSGSTFLARTASGNTRVYDSNLRIGNIIVNGTTDGDVKFTNTAGTSGAILVASAADTLTLEKLDSSAGATFDMGSTGNIQWGAGTNEIRNASGFGVWEGQYGGSYYMQNDMSAVGESMFRVFGNGASAELTAASGTQYVIRGSGVVNQSSTAAAVALMLDPTDTASGSGQDYLILGDWGADASYEFVVEDDGDTTIGGVANIEGGNGKGALTIIDLDTPTTLTFAADPGDASKTATNFRTAQKHIYGVSGRVTTTGTNCTSMDIGDGTDVDRYGDNIAITSGTVFDIDDATADPSEFLTTAGDVVVTGVGGNCFDLVVKIILHYRTYQGATSD